MTGPDGAPRPELGIGQIISDVFLVFFRRFPKVIALAMPGGLAIGGIFYFVFLAAEGLSQRLLGSAEMLFTAGVLAVAVALGTGLGLAAGPVAGAFHDYQIRGEMPFWPSLGRTIRRPLAAIFCGVLVTVATSLPFTAIVLGGSGNGGFVVTLIAIAVGIYAMGRWGTALPAISMDRLGVSALGRANALGRGYRWQIAGTCFVLWISATLFGGALAAGLGIAVAAINQFVVNISLGHRVEEMLVFLNAVLGITISTALLALGLAAIRERLVEIKEPPDIADMVDVFD